jgi:predicted membrane protein
MMNSPRRRGSIFALILIVAGVLLFLDNLGFLPIQNIRAYWPLLPVAWALAVIERRRGAHALIRASAVIVFGGLLLLGNLHVIHMTARLFAPLVLIYLGIIILIKGGDRTCHWPPRRFGAGSSLREPRFSGNRVMETAVFSGSEWRVESQNFEGGKVEAVFGGVELDLTGATITAPDRRVVLELNAVFGGIEIRVPRTWRVERESAAVFGSFEDKTVPPRPEPGFEPATLVIRGNAVFGSIEVKN